MKRIGNKRSQITIFVIIAVVIIVSIILFFAILNQRKISIKSADDVNAYIQSCLKNSLEKTNDKLISGNFYPDMDSNYFVYEGKRLKYLCKSSQFYFPCINQEPMLIEYLRKEIEKQAEIDAEKCFSEAKKSLRGIGYGIDEEKMVLNIVFMSGKISVTVEKPITAVKNEETRAFNKFYASINSALFDFAKTAIVIVNYESTLCEFNNVGWMNEYPEIKITKFSASDQTKAYTLTDRSSGDEIGFAVKTCVLPAGI